MSITVREAQAGDERAIVDLVQELAESIGETSPLGEAYVQRYLAFPGSHVLLAEEDGRISGLLSYSVRPNLYHAGGSALIEELVIHDAQRGRGVGGVLVDEVLKRLRAEGCAEVSVTTMPDNVGAQRFYRAHGLTDEAIFLEKHF